MTTAFHLERVSQGEVYGLLGRNGAGKTTMLRILMGIVRPDAGTIELLGKRTKRVTVSLKQRIGYVSQEPMFYSWMTAEHLGRFVGSFYPTWDKQEFSRLLDALDVPKDRRAADLSGGTRSKLGLALARAPRPELLLLDEPTAGLDPVARREFHDQPTRDGDTQAVHQPRDGRRGLNGAQRSLHVRERDRTAVNAAPQ